MPSQRRKRAYGLTIFLTILVVIYVTQGPGQTRKSDFFTKTQEALQQKEYAEAAQVRDAESVGARLKAAEVEAKKLAKDKGQRYFDSVDGGGGGEKGVAGRVKLTQQTGGEKKLQGVATVGGKPRDRGAANLENETPEDHEVEVELNAILKKSPIIIFSKTYCPYSMKAKFILLDTYKINPEPYVVELDEHPLGDKLQAALAETTGRKTVPNILIQGRSIGGGDDINHLHEAGELRNTIIDMGGSRIVAVSLKAGSRQERVMRV